MELPSWLSRLRARHRVHKDEGSIPGLAPWVKDPAVSCGVGQQLQLQLAPWPGNLHIPWV